MKKNKFKTSGVKADVPRMLMVHHQDVFVEMSTRLQTAQQEIQKLCDHLRDSDATIRAYQGMVVGEASDLYASVAYPVSMPNQVLIVCMTQNQLFHTYGQKCSQITKCHDYKI
jgi:hypothetical protein